MLLDAEEVDYLHFTYGVSPDGETDDTRFIMSRKGDEVEPALETAMMAGTMKQQPKLVIGACLPALSSAS